MTEIEIVRDDTGDITSLSGREHTGPIQSIRRSIIRFVHRLFALFETRALTSAQPVIGNIVCASITTVFEQFQSHTRHLPPDAVKSMKSYSATNWEITIDNKQLSASERNRVQAVFKAGVDVLEQIQESYPGQVSLQYTRHPKKTERK